MGHAYTCAGGFDSLGPVGESTKSAYTAPKGRPTRSRNGGTQQRRIFGPTTQWIALVALIALVIVVIWVVTDGGDFNPFNDGQNTGVPAGAASVAHAAAQLLLTG